MKKPLWFLVFTLGAAWSVGGLSERPLDQTQVQITPMMNHMDTYSGVPQNFDGAKRVFDGPDEDLLEIEAKFGENPSFGAHVIPKEHSKKYIGPQKNATDFPRGPPSSSSVSAAGKGVTKAQIDEVFLKLAPEFQTPAVRAGLEELAQWSDDFATAAKDLSKFAQGKNFEGGIKQLLNTSNEALIAKISERSGIAASEIRQMQKVHQLQIYLNGDSGKYVILDSALFRSIKVNGEDAYEIIAIECKLSNASPWTKGQELLVDKVNAGSTSFVTRSLDENGILQGSNVIFKSYLKAEGDIGNIINVNIMKAELP